MKIVAGGDIKIKVITKPKEEKEVLASVDKKTDRKRILKETINKAEYCVDHLCGCGYDRPGSQN